jgi:CBS domain-containing protein
MVQTQASFRGLPVHQAMVTRFATLDARETLNEAVRALLAGTQQDFPVMEDGRVVGLLTRRDLLSALSENGFQAPVAAVMHGGVEPVEASAPLDETYQRMQTEDLPALPVVQAGRLVGLLTTENITEFLMIRAAAGKFSETFTPAGQSKGV